MQISHRLIYDPVTGRPRGFGFCEYEDGETAMSAVRNLTGREVNGRPLRIDSATNAPGGEMRGPGKFRFPLPWEDYLQIFPIKGLFERNTILLYI